MTIHMGQKIKELRKQLGISQEALAKALGVSFQSVSKWETENGMPDITLVPAIASFFGVSTDELFGFCALETEKAVAAICEEAYPFFDVDPQRAEQILRDGLRRFPGNDILTKNLIKRLDPKTRAKELIELCKTQIEHTRHDELRYEAYYYMARAYREMGRTEIGQKHARSDARNLDRQAVRQSDAAGR